MKAVIIQQAGGPEHLHIGEWPTPTPASHELLVRVHTTAANRADTLQRKGFYPPPPGASPILGLEMAGEVVSFGPACSRFEIGQRVCGLLAGGGHAEYVVIHEELAIPIPDVMTYEEAAAIPEVFLTAYQALDLLGQFKAGENLLIHAGASGVGTAAIQLAREMGASDILITASAPKHELCRSLGANVCIDYKQQDFAKEIDVHTNGRGVNLIIDFIAAPYLNQNLSSLAMEGRMILLALMGGTRPEDLNMAPILRKRLQIIGSTLRARALDYKIDLTRRFTDFAWPRFQNGSLRAVIDRVVSWEDISEAHRAMEANENAGKIVLRVRA
ncbi:MAG: NAD(P)H-quinone oxidoreductase [Bacteroidota bacterium]